MNPYVIIVAGGKGVRMQHSVPKQFLEVNGQPVIMHTIRLFAESVPGIRIIVVLPKQHFPTWEELCITHEFAVPCELAEGGPTRFHSVKSGLQKITEEASLIGIHDAVRPLVSKEVITRCYQDAWFYGSAVPVIPVKESLRERQGSTSQPVDRANFVVVQTPQCFHSATIKHAYHQNYREEFTDDASVVESDGHSIHLVNGNPENIKITEPADLIFAASLMRMY